MDGAGGVRQGTHGIAEEMRFDLMRSARSPVLREAGDLSCAITDAAGATVAQGNDIPMHLGVMGYTVRLPARARSTRRRLRPGDVFFVNHPEVGGNHLPDVKAVRPVFAAAGCWAFAVALAHWPDIGGALPGSYVPHARDLQQEGLVMPPVRLFDAAGERREALDLVLPTSAAPRSAWATSAPRRRRRHRGASASNELAERHGVDDRPCARGTAMRRETAQRVRRAWPQLPGRQ